MPVAFKGVLTQSKGKINKKHSAEKGDTFCKQNALRQGFC